MSEFVVKTINDRNLFIEADSYDNNHNPDVYDFRSEGKLVASVNVHAALAVIKKENDKADFYFHDDLTEDETDDVCDECRAQEESDAFFDKVWDIISLWHEPHLEEEEPNGAEVTE